MHNAWLTNTSLYIISVAYSVVCASLGKCAWVSVCQCVFLYPSYRSAVCVCVSLWVGVCLWGYMMSPLCCISWIQSVDVCVCLSFHGIPHWCICVHTQLSILLPLSECTETPRGGDNILKTIKKPIFNKTDALCMLHNSWSHWLSVFLLSGPTVLSQVALSLVLFSAAMHKFRCPWVRPSPLHMVSRTMILKW